MQKIILLLFVFIVFGFLHITEAKDMLTDNQKNIALIASYTASGKLDKLEYALNKALDEGLTINEIKEVLVQTYAYAGFPRSLNGISAFIKVCDERNAKGIVDKTGEVGKTLSLGIDKRAYGNNVQIELIGQPTSGRYIEFTPAIDDFLKSHLFADIFGRGVLSYQDREIATIAILSSIEGLEPQLNAHIQICKHIGLTDEQIKEVLKLTSANNKGGEFGLGEENTAYAKYFVGQSYLKPLTTEGVNSANVTFEPGCRNNWHVHHKGGQILLVTSGRGYYQEWGKPAQELKAGDVVNIPAGVKHWHGAASDSWFTHIAIAIPADGASTEWLEEVSDKEYAKLK